MPARRGSARRVAFRRAEEEEKIMATQTQYFVPVLGQIWDKLGGFGGRS